MRRSTPRAIALSTLAVAALGAATVGLSGATFATQTGAAHVTVDAGDLRLTSTKDGQGVVADATGLRPGVTRSGTVTVSNAGSADAEAFFDAAPEVVDVPASPALSSVLRFALERCPTGGAECPGAEPVLEGVTLAQAAAADRTALGAAAPGSASTYRVTLSWPQDEADPDLQAASTQATLGFAMEAGE
ncbi:hypothetical protein [Conexibacter sp. SYSU D00693]|uniref:hypothetical protein n=1 Tax=Conexibacter sp. SYSU D00693 TaxID=2812560 RepID=UPI00196A36C6|nr:hypothetical protein [Conexibacter sp. SYSU D00693]